MTLHIYGHVSPWSKGFATLHKYDQVSPWSKGFAIDDSLLLYDWSVSSTLIGRRGRQFELILHRVQYNNNNNNNKNKKINNNNNNNNNESVSSEIDSRRLSGWYGN